MCVCVHGRVSSGLCCAERTNRDETLQVLGFADTAQVSVINYQRGFVFLVSNLCRYTHEEEENTWSEHLFAIHG